MSTFEEAIPTLLKHEGKLTNNSADRGDITNFGISLRYLKSLGQLDYDLDGDGDIDSDDIKRMTIEQACKIYQQNWWNKYEYFRINDQAVATKVFDMAVNMGQKQAVKLLQRACKKVAGEGLTAVDGVLGPKTINTVNSTNSVRLLEVLRSEQAAFYQDLINRDPKLIVFEKGWLKRAYA
jgi:lysozyme family protein